MVKEFLAFKRQKTWSWALIVALASMPYQLSAAATRIDDDSVASLGSVGPAIIQTFLPNGASVVRTQAGASCVVSARILIEDSSYVDVDGIALDFANIRRSPATSIQAIAPEEGALRFRIQLKYSPRADRPIRMTVGDIDWDLSDALEKSTDSLLLTGERAVVLAEAFRNGLRPHLVAISRDNDHVVTDRIEVPDLATLDTCKAELGPDPSQSPSPLVSLRFDADPANAPLATLGQLQDCRMDEAPGDLHLARIEQTTGFFSQTDKVFVAFDDEGKVTRAYVPGIFDADFRRGRNAARVSIAANSNVPMEDNEVKGCLGLAPVKLCSYNMGSSRYLGLCETPFAGLVDPDIEVASVPDPVGNWRPPVFTPPGGGTPPGTTTSTPIPPKDPKTPGGEPEIPPTVMPPAPIPPIDVTPVPLPPSAFLLLGTFAVMAGLRRRKAR